MRLSLSTRLGLFWLLILITCASLALLMLGMVRQGASAQIDEARGLTQSACAAIRNQYARYPAKPGDAANANLDLLNVLLQLTLAEASGVEGGVWDRDEGFLAYAFPTYEGAGEKRDVPETERSRIADIALRSASEQAPQTSLQRGSREALVLSACPLAGDEQKRVAWTLKRVPAAAADAVDRLTLGLGLLLAFVLASGAWLGLLLARWSRRLGALERSLSAQSVEELPALPPTGEHELDRIVAALNQLGERLRTARKQSAELTAKLAQADRLAALGRMAAGLAHEIRNPIAAMRLRAENALAHLDRTDTRQHGSFDAIVKEIDRLDALLASLLAMTQPFAFEPRRVEIAPWTDERVAALRERADAGRVVLQTRIETSECVFDPAQLARAVDNLLLNALQHTPPGGTITLAVVEREKNWIVSVADTGSGIDPKIREHLFEPFVSARSGGTGLGLALVREIAALHGGEVRAAPVERGACLEIELPWRKS